MENRWLNKEAGSIVDQSKNTYDNLLNDVLYATRLIGSNPDLTLHGGGNTSLKTSYTTLTGEKIDALIVKASGVNMAAITAEQFAVMRLTSLKNLGGLSNLSDEQMADEFCVALLRPIRQKPSIETLMHAFLPQPVILHTHPTAILACTNRRDGMEFTQKACTGATVIPYATVGFDLAAAVAKAYLTNPKASGIIIMNHGLVTWGSSAQAAYESTINLVTVAESFLNSHKNRVLENTQTPALHPQELYARIAPIIRGAMSRPVENADSPFEKIVLKPLFDEKIVTLISSDNGKELSVSQPLTPDYLIRTRRQPLFIETPRFDDETALREQLCTALTSYQETYQKFVSGFSQDNPVDTSIDYYPRVIIIPGLGVVCAGNDEREAAMVCDIMRQTLAAKATIYETGGVFCGINDEHLFNMEFRSFQRAKLDKSHKGVMPGTIALVTGAAGAIGFGVCRALAEAGCHVAVTDLVGPQLDATVKELQEQHGNRICGIPLDVTDPLSVEAGFRQVSSMWGGIDTVIVNAGIAHVALLQDLPIEAFRKLEKVNIEGTLLLLAEAGRVFKRQNIGGDIVLISTKNVFAPGASFGAYSATKAAAHQLARIASLEMAGMNVRVNMVAPDAVFSDGSRKSGLWATVGPDRMRARGLDEKGLENYYQSRNLLKARVTAEHVARAVLFFITHQTPTTGATIPVDGGLPDATPR